MPSSLLNRLFDRLPRVGQSGQQLPVIGTSADRQPFDLTKVQYETTRLRKRRQVLRRSLPCVILVGIVALWFLLPATLTHRAIADYKHQHYRTARHWLTPLTWTSPQPFVIAFNSGTVDTQLGHYVLAQNELTRALALAPADKRCMVLQNLAISLTDHASSLKLQASSQDAATLDSEASNLKIDNPKCFHIVKPTPPKNNQGGGGGGGGGTQFQQILTASQQQQLLQKNELGQQSQQQNFLPNTVNPNSPNYKPW